jgi:uncharacterized membrane protein YqjE
MSELGTDRSEPAGTGFIQPVKELVAVLSAAFHTRLELLVTEAQEELERTKRTLALFLVLLYAASFGLTLLTIFLVALLWQKGWIAAIGLLAAVYIGVAVAAVLKLRGSTQRPDGLFPVTLGELAKDRDHLRAAAREQ